MPTLDATCSLGYRLSDDEFSAFWIQHPDLHCGWGSMPIRRRLVQGALRIGSWTSSCAFARLLSTYGQGARRFSGRLSHLGNYIQRENRRDMLLVGRPPAIVL